MWYKFTFAVLRKRESLLKLSEDDKRHNMLGKV